MKHHNIKLYKSKQIVYVTYILMYKHKSDQKIICLNTTTSNEINLILGDHLNIKDTIFRIRSFGTLPMQFEGYLPNYVELKIDTPLDKDYVVKYHETENNKPIHKRIILDCCN